MNNIEVFKGIDHVFNGFENPFLKKLIEFFTFNCRFYSVFLVVWNLLDNDRSHLLFWRSKSACILNLVDSCWISGLWKQFSKQKTTLFSFAFLFFFVYLLLSLVNYNSHMITLSVEWRCNCINFIVFKEFVMNLLSSTPVFRKKK